MNYSIVQFLKERSGHSCGYCKSNGNFSDGMWAHMLTVQDYQDLIDRGWRRSGTFCYKPHMSVTCCPAYTIKCDVLNFKLTKSQKKILKRMRKFLIDGKRTDSEISADSSSVDEGEAEGNPDRIRLESVPDTVIVDIDMKDVDTSMTDECGSNSTRMDSVNIASSVSSKVGSDSLEGSSQHSLTSPIIQKKNPHKVQGRDLTRPLQKKAKLIRLKRREKKCQEGQQAVSKKTVPQGKSLDEFLNEPLPENSKHNLEVRLVNFTEPDDQNERLLSEELLVYRKYQVAIHNDPIEKCTARHFTRFLVQSPLKVLPCKYMAEEIVSYPPIDQHHAPVNIGINLVNKY